MWQAKGGIFITTKTIRINTIADVKKFCSIVIGCEYEVDIVSGRYAIDAKRIMGIFSLDLSKPLTLEIYCDDCAELLEKLAKFAV